MSGRRCLSSSFSFSGVVFLLRLVFFDGIFVFSGEEGIKMKWRGTEVVKKMTSLKRKYKNEKGANFTTIFLGGVGEVSIVFFDKFGKKI